MNRAASYSDKFAALSIREKGLIFGAGAVLILLTGITFFIEPKLQAADKYSAELVAADTTQRNLLQQQGLFEEALRQDPDAELKAQLLRLESRYAAMQARFATQLNELVLPQQMPLLIENVFKRADNLELLEMASIAPVNIFADNPDMVDVALYQHGVKLTFSGRYFDVRNFLASLEHLKAQIYWRSIDYKVETYPQALITLEVYTLSTEKAFIGVE